ncbi:MAG TPA: MASE1 domain-containing protein [Vicinamibacterales bacterium]
MKAGSVRHEMLASVFESPASRATLFSLRRLALLARARALFTTNLAAQLALVFLAYVIAGKLGQATTNIRSGNIGPVWPAYGVALAGVLAFGNRVWPAIAASAFVVAFQSPVYVLAALGQAAGATLAVVSGATVLRRIPGFTPSFARLRDALAFVVYGAFGSALISSSIGLASLYFAGATGYSGLGAAWLIYWLGDATGALLVTPLAFALPSAFWFRSVRERVEYAALLVLLLGLCAVIFYVEPFGVFEARLLTFAVLPFVMWAAINFGLAGAASTVFVIATIATVSTAMGVGPFGDDSPFTGAVRLDLVYGVLAVTGLTLSALIAERESAQAEREQSIRAQAAMQTRLHLAAIVESSNDAVLSMSLDGTIQSWNASAERIFGWMSSEAIGRPVWELIPSWRWPEEGGVLEQLAGSARLEPWEAVGVTKSGAALNLSVTVLSLRDPDGKMFGLATILRDITASKRAEEALSNLSQRLIDAQEQERRRIARELHDDISQRLATLAIHLQGSSELQQMVGAIATDVQALSHELHSSRLELLGITVAMRHFCAEFAEQQQSTVAFDSRDVPRSLRPDISLCLFRILQESLHNAVKHSGVHQFEVRLWGSPGQVHLSVSDRGKGFDVRAARTGRGIGLISMDERLKLVGGNLSVGSQPHGGTTVHARVPVAP